MAYKETNVETAFPVSFPDPVKDALRNPGNPITKTLRPASTFSGDQAAGTATTATFRLPGGTTDYWEVAAARLRNANSATHAFGTGNIRIGIMPAGGTYTTDAIAVYEFSPGTTVQKLAIGTYAAASTPKSPKLKLKGGTDYVAVIMLRPTDGSSVACDIAEFEWDIKPVKTFDA